MDHVAIMKKSWGLLPRILSGEKKIESRWYKVKAAPWGKIGAGETIYFKNSGEPVTVKAKVDKVKVYADLTPGKVRQILKDYARDDGIEAEDIKVFYERFKSKKYCLLIFLKDPQKIKPFQINKKGFGAMAAWISVERVEKIKV